MTARHHHYISQCYLKGFSKGGSKKSKLLVIDLKEKKQFETIPRNVGGLRDFNRIDFEGVDQNIIENDLAKFEGEAATALKKLGENLSFEGINKSLILNLIALFAVRSPERREHWRKFQAQIVETMTALTLASKERWESQIKQMKDSGHDVDDNVTYEDAKKFFDSKKYTISVPREQHIHIEFVGMEAILPTLYDRNWLLLQSTEDSGPFITTDNPVSLTWKDPEKVPPFQRNSPGFGLIDTQLCFPVSKNLALVGEFDSQDGTTEATKEFVSAINTRMIQFANKQIYASKAGFYFLGKGNEILEGKQLLRQISA